MFTSFVFGFAAHLPAYAQTLPASDLSYLDGTFAIHAAPDGDARPMGKLLVSAPLQVTSHQGDWSEVVLQGWTQAGAERILYAAPGIRVLHAALSKSAITALTFSDQITDPDTGLVWTRTELKGWIKSPVLRPGLQDIWARAEPLFSERCTACHQRRIPHHYTANQWTSHLKIMGPRTGLPKEDQFLIRAYLQYHSKDADRLGPTPAH
ncbi:hypothetical protein [Aliiroseovarius crassostreae]|uniref:hypothetical protein n=1 Tax=Aliiroseovarius crassostreae TaxID=154981 RepID=UPI003C7CBA19